MGSVLTAYENRVRHKITSVEVMRRMRDKRLSSPLAMLTHSFLYFNVSDAVARCWGKNENKTKSQSSMSLFSVFLTLNQTSSLWRTNRTDPPPNEQAFLFVGLKLSNQSCPNILPTFLVMFITILIVNSLHLPLCMIIPCALS